MLGCRFGSLILKAVETRGMVQSFSFPLGSRRGESSGLLSSGPYGSFQLQTRHEPNAAVSRNRTTCRKPCGDIPMRTEKGASL